MDINSSRQQDARRAVGLSDASIEVHNRHIEPFNIEIRRNSALRDRSFVLSASLGLLHASTVLGYIAGLQSRSSREGGGWWCSHGSSGLTTPRTDGATPCIKGGVRTLLGMGVLCGSGLAISFLASCAMERHVYELEFHRELWEIHNFRDGEVSEMIDIYCNMGLRRKDAETVVDIFAKSSPSIFAHLMMVEELGYPRLSPPTVTDVLHHASISTILGYTLGMILPLTPLFIPFKLFSASPSTNPGVPLSIRSCAKGSGQGTWGVAGVAGRVASSLCSSGAIHPPILCGVSLLAVGAVLEGAGRSAVYFGSYAESRTRLAATLFFLTSAATVFSGAFFVGKHFYHQF